MVYLHYLNSLFHRKIIHLVDIILTNNTWDYKHNDNKLTHLPTKLLCTILHYLHMYINFPSHLNFADKNHRQLMVNNSVFRILIHHMHLYCLNNNFQSFHQNRLYNQEVFQHFLNSLLHHTLIQQKYTHHFHIEIPFLNKWLGLFLMDLFLQFHQLRFYKNQTFLAVVLQYLILFSGL